MAKNVVLEDIPVHYIWLRNFSGVAKDGKPEGNRYFLLSLDPDLAMRMKEDGWNVKFNDPDSPYLPYIQVGVRFDKYPASIYRHRRDGSTEEITERQVGLLDHAKIEQIDLIIRPYEYDMPGRHGIKAYLDTMDVTIAENPLDIKYGR